MVYCLNIWSTSSVMSVFAGGSYGYSLISMIFSTDYSIAHVINISIIIMEGFRFSILILILFI